MEKNQFTYHLSFRLDFYDDTTGLVEYLYTKNYPYIKEVEQFLDMKEKRIKNLEDGHSSFIPASFYLRDKHGHEILKFIYQLMGLKIYSVSWTDIELTEENIYNLINTLEEFDSKQIAFIGGGSIFERLKDNFDEVEWFLLNGEFVDAYDSKSFELFKGDYPTCKSYRYPPLLHVQGNFISEKFKKVVEDYQLSGLDFLWIEDKGKYKAEQWYAAVSEKPIGHGIDHPWFGLEAYSNFVRTKYYEALKETFKDIKEYGYDHDEIVEKQMGKKLEQLGINEYRKGTFYYDIGAVSIDNVYDVSIRKLLKYLPQEGYNGSISVVPRFYRNYLPDSDFAYHWLETRQEDFRSRNLYINKKAKEILLKENVIREEQLSPVSIYDELPKGCEDLDIDRGFPPSLLTQEELKALREKESKRKEKYDSKELPVRKPTMKNALALLRDAKKERIEDFGKRVTKKKMEQYKSETTVKLPSFWLDVLSVANGGWYGKMDALDCTIMQIQEIDDFHNDLAEVRKSDGDDFVNEYTYFASSITGDFFAFLKIPTDKIEDAKIVLISHEDFSVEREWEGVADFLESVILGI